MADIVGMLDELQQKTRKNPEWQEAFFQSREAEDPLAEFCRLCRGLGYEIYIMPERISMLLCAEVQTAGERIRRNLPEKTIFMNYSLPD